MANQSQNLAAIMDNFDTAIAATETALNSQGSAAQENERYMESFEGKLSIFHSQETFKPQINISGVCNFCFKFRCNEVCIGYT